MKTNNLTDGFYALLDAASHDCSLKHLSQCCICCGPDEEHILDVVPREDGARNSG